MTIQQIIERLLRSRLYKTGVAIETDTGEIYQGRVKEVRYDGSRSFVVVTPAGLTQPATIPLARITRVATVGGSPPKAGAAA